MRLFSSPASRRLVRPRVPVVLTILALLISTIAGPALADGGIAFTDIAAGGANGLAYNRVASPTEAIWDFYRAQGTFFFFDIPMTPLKSRGAPGVVLFDADRDGDEDLYVTNGPGAANSLFLNQLVETGTTTFVDTATASGVAATGHDSSGACAGDIDNDGDPDLLILSFFEPSRLFENQGDGTFVDVSASSGLAGGGESGIACSFGDIDNDGLLDVAVANGCDDMGTQVCIIEPFTEGQHNRLFRNLGGNTFADVSATSGIRDTTGFGPGLDGAAALSWAIALVDIDQDGDVDLVHADDQGGVPFPRDGGVNYGLIHVFTNDGTGHFTDQTATNGLIAPGNWMGLSFGDLDHDGHLDLFGSNLGDWASTLISPLDPVYADFFNYQLGDASSRWFLGSADGTFTDPGLGGIVATPFGWGTVIFDYDNDTDSDILFHGGLLPGGTIQTAPAALLRNDGTGSMSRDVVAFAGSTDHQLRTVQGVATGDLNRDGFADVVSVSNFDIPAGDPSLATYNHAWGSPFDGGTYSQFFQPTATPLLTSYSGAVYPDGTLSVELSSADNGNGSVGVSVLGTVGLTTGGTVNRDGLGAVLSFTPTGRATAIKPVIGGASYASQDSLEKLFGLGDGHRGRVEVLWPGGVRNRLYFLRDGDRVTVPEIPCSYDADWPHFFAYKACVRGALVELRTAGVITKRERARLFLSAVIAYFDH